MKVEIWSDVVCPWCHIGKRRFESALSRFAHRDQVEVHWKSFELDPTALSSGVADGAPPGGYAQRLATKYAITTDSAQRMIESMTAAAAAEGLDFRFDRALPANTFDAHQVIHLAAEHGIQDAVKERLLRAYFTEGQAVGDREVLVVLAAEVGLAAAEIRGSLDEQRFAAAVRADEAEAAALGVRGVPFFVIDRAYGVSGAQPPEQLLAALQQAWAGREPLQVIASGSGSTAPVCGPDGCAV